MVPLPVPLRLPISTGLAKLPEALESCAVKVLPALKTPVAVKGTLTIWPAQNGPAIAPVVSAAVLAHRSAVEAVDSAAVAAASVLPGARCSMRFVRSAARRRKFLSSLAGPVPCTVAIASPLTAPHVVAVAVVAAVVSETAVDVETVDPVVTKRGFVRL